MLSGNDKPEDDVDEKDKVTLMNADDYMANHSDKVVCRDDDDDDRSERG